jgi:nucleotidyltransferase/DNA polymerase involved in DNA repair
MRVLCARYPHLGLVAALRRFAELRGEAVIVGGAPELRLPVIAASRAALTAGVRAGQPLRQAQQLCPGAAFVPVDTEAVEELRGSLVVALQSLSPVVEVGDQEALCDLSGRHAAFADEGGWATATAQMVYSALSVEPPSVGVASSRFVARMAAQVSSAGRIRRVRPGGEAAFLAPLPLDVLPVKPSITARLAAFGLDCVGAVAALSPSDLQRQFGSDGLQVHELARGEDDQGVQPVPAQQAWCERLVLEGATGDLETLLRAARHCADALGGRLTGSGMAAGEASIVLEVEEGEAVSATTCPAAPLGNAADAWMAVLGLMSDLTPPAPVSAVRVGLTRLTTSGARQSDLLRPGDSARENVAIAAGRLRLRFGEGSVRRPVLAVDPGDVPERRFMWKDPVPAATR